MRQLFMRLARRLALALPAQFHLPWLTRLDQWKGVEPESRWLSRIGPCRGTAIDVGANYGLYSYALSRHYERVIAFEPNPQAAEPLKDWNSPKVQLIPVGLSASAGSATLFVPTTRGLELSGWGSLHPDNCPDAEQLTERIIELRTLDSFGFDDVGFIKIDAEGHELEVLQGGAETIKRHKPHLLIEVRSREPEVFQLLASWGYRVTTLLELTGVAGAPANYIFLPASQSFGVQAA